MQGLTGIVEIEESYDKIIALAGGIPRRPVIIVVYGMPHHGKTFFIQEKQYEIRYFFYFFFVVFKKFIFSIWEEWCINYK